MVKTRKRTTDPTPAPKNRQEMLDRIGEWATLEEAGQYCHVSGKTIRRRVADGTIEGRRIGRLIRVRVADLQRLMSPVV